MADLSFDDLVPDKAKPGAAASQVNFDDLVPQQPHVNPIVDVAKSGWAGVQQGVTALPAVLGEAENMWGNAVDAAGHKVIGALQDVTGNNLGAPYMGGKPGASDPGSDNYAHLNHHVTGQDLNDARQGVTGPDYVPQTVAGEYARKIGQMAPNAVFPGGLAARVANVVVPAVAGETARLGARAAGASPDAQNAADFAGSLAGGAAANVRVGAPKGEPTPVPHTPTLDELRAQKNAAYSAVDNAGIQYSPEAVNGLVSNIKAQTQAAMVDPDLHPQATAIIKRIDQLQDEPLTLTKLDQIRRLARDNVIASASKDQRRVGYVIQNAIDSFINGARPSDLIGAADPQTAAATLATARDLNTRVAKMETVQTAADKANNRVASTYSGGNTDNALRQNLRKVLERSRGLTDDEQNALTAAVVGTPVQNVLRRVGKLAPDGAVSMLGHLGLGYGTHGATLPTAVAGMAAKAVANGMSKANVQRVMDLMATGGNAEALQLAQMAAHDARVDNLVRQLSRVSMNSSTINALSGARPPQSQTAGQ